MLNKYAWLFAFFIFAFSAADAGEQRELPADWKESVYAHITKGYSQRNLDNERYLFLGAPVYCTVTQRSKIPLSRSKKEHVGYAGLVSKRAKGAKSIWSGRSDLFMYMLDMDGNVSLFVGFKAFELYETSPKLYEHTVHNTSNGGKSITTRPLIAPAELMRLAAFRKAETIEDLPPYQ